MWRKGNPLTLLVGMETSTATRENSVWRFLKKIGTRTSISSVQSLSCVWLFATPWTAALQASLSITNSRNLPKLMSIESLMPSNNLMLCCPLLLLPSIFPSIRVFSNESVQRSKWPKYWSLKYWTPKYWSFNTPKYSILQSIEVSASTSVLPMNIKDWFPLELIGWIALLSKGL